MDVDLGYVTEKGKSHYAESGGDLRNELFLRDSQSLMARKCKPFTRRGVQKGNARSTGPS